MAQATKDLLTILKAELAYVESGGYRAPEQAAWRPQFIFEDSPTCLNYRNFGKPHPCSQCPLIEFVPSGFKKERFPCRYIPLDGSGNTLDFLYRMATEEEAHAIVAGWLRATIAQLEKGSPSCSDAGTSSDSRALSATHSN